MPGLLNPSRFASSLSGLDAVYAGISTLYQRYKFTETSGTTAADTQGVNAGTYVGSPTLDGATVTTDGNTQEVTCPFNTISMLTAGWLVWIGKTSDAAIQFRNDTSAAGTGTFLDLSGTNPVVRASGTSHTVTAVTSASIRDGALHDLVIQTDGTTVEFWVDGTMVDSWAKTATWGSVAGNSPWHLGRNGTLTGTSNFSAAQVYDFATGTGGKLTSTNIANIHTNRAA